MTKVIFDISMSLDGFMTASNQTPEEPLGDGGERLHEWAFSAADGRSREVLSRGVETAGAVIAGRRPTTTRCRGGAPTARPARPASRSLSSPTANPRTCLPVGCTAS